MSKKRFTDGLENLFTGPEDSALQSGNQLLSGENTKTRQPKLARVSSSNTSGEERATKKSSGKRFSDDLQSFLMEAFEESFERQIQQPLDTGSIELKKRSQKPMSGLDALIRTTIDPKIQLDSAYQLRRLTVAFDEQKLEKLKTIARMEKTYLRDIIDVIVADYIKEYEIKRGKL
jgi:hypothetical protein